MNFRRLRCFLAASEEENFGRAADRLNIVHSAFSRQIQHLEADLGVQLFERIGRRVKLSDAGRIYAERVRELLDSFERANEEVRAIGGDKHNHLRIGLQEDIGHKSAITRVLRNARLGVANLTASYFPMSSMDQPAALDRHDIDIGLIYGDPTLTRNFNQMVIAHDRYVLALSKEHPLAQRDGISIEDLANEDFVHIAIGQNPGLQKDLIARCQTLGLELRIVNRANTKAGILALIATNGGVALVPELMGATDDFRCMEISGLHITIPVDLIWRRDDHGRLLQNYIASWQRILDEEPLNKPFIMAE